MFGDDKEKWAVNELVRKSEELKSFREKTISMTPHARELRHF